MHKGDHPKFKYKVGTALRDPIKDFNWKTNIFNFNINLKLDINIINNILIRKFYTPINKHYKTINFIEYSLCESVYKIHNNKADTL